MLYKIGVFGSAAGATDEILSKAKQIGKKLGEEKCTVITGACMGLPYAAAYEAKTTGAKVWGFSPEHNWEGQKQFTPENQIEYDKIIYTPENFILKNNSIARKKYRDVVSTGHCDGAIIISGRWGSMNEFTNLVDMGKVIGVLTGTGGIADELPRLYELLKKKKPSAAIVIFNDNPKKLVEEVLDKIIIPKS